MCTKFVVHTLFLCILICYCDGSKRNVKRKVDVISDVTDNKFNSTSAERGFMPRGILSWGKVLNFFPVGGERECKPSGFSIAKAGICINPYDCRQRDGRALGDCAHGLGVCCVFEVTCGATVQNNITYFTSPGFPELWAGDENCSIHIEKSHAGVMQLRIDFIHFVIGQPNRTTGECDEDAMILGEGEANFTLCGQNHAQHIYYNLPSETESRDAEDLPTTKPTPLLIRMRGSEMPRLWLLRLTLMPLAQSSPHNCLQYHLENNGTIKTFNYASNGRHLASQEYRACIRRNVGYCSIRYSPCDRRSFRIGPRGDDVEPAASEPMDEMMPVDDMMPVDEMMLVDEETSQDEEGSGIEPQIETSSPQPSVMSRIWSFIWPFQQRSLWGWSPYLQHYSAEKLKYYGYGNYAGHGFGRQKCTDRVTIPCENEYFVSSPLFGPGVCDPHNCGDSLCPGKPFKDCHVDSSITPFAVSVHFGVANIKQNPEDNIGMCLKYSQIPCNS